MATILKLNCKKCNQSFELCSGLLQSNLTGVSVGADLPNGAKLPSKEEFAKIYKDKTTESTEAFIGSLEDHLDARCGGEVVLGSIISAH